MGYYEEARLRKDMSGKYREHRVRKISEDGVFHNPIWDWLYRCLGVTLFLGVLSGSFHTLHTHRQLLPKVVNAGY